MALPRSEHGVVARVAAAALTAGAGAIHLAVVPDHLREYLLFGIFFAVVGAAQLGAAVTLLRPTRPLILGVAIGQALLVALWLVSRTTGLPIGPQPWTPEEIGVADVVCIGLELLSVAVLAGLLVRAGLGAALGARSAAAGPAAVCAAATRVRAPRARSRRSVWGAAAVVVPVALVTFVGVGSGLSGMPDAFSVAPPGAGGARRSPRSSRRPALSR